MVSSGICNPRHETVQALTLTYCESFSLGPEDLTEDTLSPDTTSEIPTVEDNIFSGCGTDSDTIGIYFEPTTSAETVNGELTLGGSDFTRFLPNSEVFIPLSK